MELYSALARVTSEQSPLSHLLITPSHPLVTTQHPCVLSPLSQLHLSQLHLSCHTSVSCTILSVQLSDLCCFSLPLSHTTHLSGSHSHSLCAFAFSVTSSEAIQPGKLYTPAAPPRYPLSCTPLSCTPLHFTMCSPAHLNHSCPAPLHLSPLHPAAESFCYVQVKITIDGRCNADPRTLLARPQQASRVVGKCAHDPDILPQRPTLLELRPGPGALSAAVKIDMGEHPLVPSAYTLGAVAPTVAWTLSGSNDGKQWVCCMPLSSVCCMLLRVCECGGAFDECFAAFAECVSVAVLLLSVGRAGAAGCAASAASRQELEV